MHGRLSKISEQHPEPPPYLMLLYYDVSHLSVYRLRAGSRVLENDCYQILMTRQFIGLNRSRAMYFWNNNVVDTECNR